MAKRRTAGGLPPNPRKAEIIRRVRMGESVQAIALDVGLTDKRILQLARHAGLPLARLAVARRLKRKAATKARHDEARGAALRAAKGWGRPVTGWSLPRCGDSAAHVACRGRSGRRCSCRRPWCAGSGSRSSPGCARQSESGWRMPIILRCDVCGRRIEAAWLPSGPDRGNPDDWWLMPGRPAKIACCSAHMCPGFSWSLSPAKNLLGLELHDHGLSDVDAVRAGQRLGPSTKQYSGITTQQQRCCSRHPPLLAYVALPDVSINLPFAAIREIRHFVPLRRSRHLVSSLSQGLIVTCSDSRLCFLVRRKLVAGNRLGGMQS